MPTEINLIDVAFIGAGVFSLGCALILMAWPTEDDRDVIDRVSRS